jgi:hypothetical protein
VAGERACGSRERERALERERERETEETEMRFLYSQMDAIQRKLDWVTRERP